MNILDIDYEAMNSIVAGLIITILVFTMIDSDRGGYS